MNDCKTMLYRVAAAATEAWATPKRAHHRDSGAYTPLCFATEASEVFSAVFAEFKRRQSTDLIRYENSGASELALHIAVQWAASPASRCGPQSDSLVGAEGFGVSVATAYVEALQHFGPTLISQQMAASEAQGSVDA